MKGPVWTTGRIPEPDPAWEGGLAIGPAGRLR